MHSFKVWAFPQLEENVLHLPSVHSLCLCATVVGKRTACPIRGSWLTCPCHQCCRLLSGFLRAGRQRPIRRHNLAGIHKLSKPNIMRLADKLLLATVLLHLVGSEGTHIHEGTTAALVGALEWLVYSLACRTTPSCTHPPYCLQTHYNLHQLLLLLQLYIAYTQCIQIPMVFFCKLQNFDDGSILHLSSHASAACLKFAYNLSSEKLFICTAPAIADRNIFLCLRINFS